MKAESCESHIGIKLQVAHGKNEPSCRQILITVAQDLASLLNFRKATLKEESA